MKRVKFLIIGAGPTGLGAAYRLREAGEEDYMLLERQPWIGGLAASFCDDAGFTWDIGGHVQFSHYPYFDKAMGEALSPANWLQHERESWIWMRERFIPYPFQNNIRYLPREQMWECLEGMIDSLAAEKDAVPHSFKEWILASFGSGVARHFMIPYNHKVWAYPPEQMNYSWIGERVATVDLRKILENILFEKTDVSWGPNRTFNFPRSGGTGAIWNNIADIVGRTKIFTNSTVRQINAQRKEVTTENFEIIGYDHLLSTMPLDIFMNQIKQAPPSLKKLAQRLKHSTSNIVGLGFRGNPDDQLARKCWMYFPEDLFPFYRMTVFSNYSPDNTPSLDCYSLMCETSESPLKPVSRETLADETLESLKAAGLIPAANKCISKWTFTAPYGYPTPSLERNNILSEIIPYLDKTGTFSRGRFGGWKYEVSNQDHSFMQGVEWVNRLLFGESETTFRVDSTVDPNLAELKQLKQAKQ